MTTLLLGYDNPRFPLLTLAGARPLLLTCPPELMQAVRASAWAESAEPAAERAIPTVAQRVVKLERSAERIEAEEAPPPPPTKPRGPEQQIDPRTAFKRRNPTVPTGVRVRSAEPPTIEAAANATHDFIVIPGNPGFRASEQGVKALLVYLRTSQILAAKAQRQDGEATIIELLPDVFSHLAFTEGAAPIGEPSVLEGVLWFSSKAAPLPFADPSKSVLFRIEMIGARFAKLSDQFLARIQQILYLRPEALATAHDPTRLRVRSARVVADPIPRFDMQEL